MPYMSHSPQHLKIVHIIKEKMNGIEKNYLSMTQLVNHHGNGVSMTEIIVCTTRALPWIKVQMRKIRDGIGMKWLKRITSPITALTY